MTVSEMETNITIMNKVKKEKLFKNWEVIYIVALVAMIAISIVQGFGVIWAI